MLHPPSPPPNPDQLLSIPRGPSAMAVSINMEAKAIVDVPVHASNPASQWLISPSFALRNKSISNVVAATAKRHLENHKPKLRPRHLENHKKLRRSKKGLASGLMGTGEFPLVF